MDPIEAQIAAQIENIQAQQNFENYQPSVPTGITPMTGILPMANQMNLVPQGREVGLKEIAQTAAANVVKNKVMEAAAKKIGIEQLGLAGQIPVIGGLVQNLAPPVLGFTGLAAIKNKIANRGLQDVINRESTRDLQQRIDKGEFGSNVPTPQDAARATSGGGGSGNYGMPGRAATGYEDL